MSISPVTYNAAAAYAALTNNASAGKALVVTDTAGTTGGTLDIAVTPAVMQIEQAAAKAIDAKLETAVASINKFLKPVASSIEFSIDEQSGRTLVKVIDTDTNDVLRQYPSKEALAISQELDKLQGLLIRDKA